MDGSEGEEVARPAHPDRHCPQIVAVLGERDRPGCCEVRLAPRSGRKGKTGDVLGETPTTAVETTALLRNWISEHSRPLASIRGSMRNSLIFWTGLTQLVDFHNSSRFFSWCWLCRVAVIVDFSKIQNSLPPVVIFQVVSDSCRYFPPIFLRRLARARPAAI